MLTGQPSPATVPCQPPPPPLNNHTHHLPSGSMPRTPERAVSQLKPKGIPPVMGRAASPRLCRHSATAQSTETKPDILQCSQTARGTRVPLWYPFEAHDLRIHAGGIDHQDEYQDTTNVPKCTEITAARPGQGLNDPSTSGT